MYIIITLFKDKHTEYLHSNMVYDYMKIKIIFKHTLSLGVL